MVMIMINDTLKNISAKKMSPRIRNLAFVIGALMYSGIGQAGVGPIVPSYGTVTTLPLDFNPPTITDPSENQTGQTPVIDQSVGAGKVYYGHCAACGDVYPPATFFTARPGDATALPNPGAGGLTYYKVNDNLGVGIKIRTQTTSNTYVWQPVPYENISNNTKPNSGAPNPSGSVSKYPYQTGSQAQITLLISKPFIGSSVIPPTVVARMYATADSGNFDYSSPMAEVVLSGTVTVAQSCKFNSGQALAPINFGDILTSEISGPAGSGPSRTAKNIEINVDCTNISQGVSFRMKLNGEGDANNPDFLKTENPDVGIKITELGSTTPISPNGGIFPAGGALNFDFTNPLNPTGKTTITAMPVNSSGAEPAKGTFNATATVTIELE